MLTLNSTAGLGTGIRKMHKERERERESCSEKKRGGQIERAIVYNLRTSGSPLRHLRQLIGHSY